MRRSGAALPGLLLAIALAAAASAQVPAGLPAPSAAPAVAPAPKPAVVHVTMTTSEGAIGLDIETERAPITAANFLRYVDQKRFDGVAFYRAVNVAPGYGLIQGGVRNDPKRVLPPIAHEPTSRTGLSHVDGAISMPRAAPGTASGDFFITVGDLTSMDADPSKPGDNQGFAVFGRVTSGMDVVRRILAAPTAPDAGPAAMKGQMLRAPVRILTVRRAP